MSNLNKKVLIAFTGKFGYIQEISERIAEILNEEGIDTQLINLTISKSKEIPPINHFNGIITGSSKYPFKKEDLKENRNLFKFYKPNLKILQKKGKILGRFLSTPFLFPKTFEFAENLSIKIRRTKLIVNLEAAFGPVIDFSQSSKLNKEEIKYLRDFAKYLNEKVGIMCDPNGNNDFRDWDRVKDFAKRFADLIKKN